MAAAGGSGRVLVTGGTGFLGRHLLDLLAEGTHEVVVLVREETDRTGLAGRPIIPVKADYDDPASLLRALEGVTRVYHLGAAVDDQDEEILERGNVRATRSLAEACLRARSGPPLFVYASSIAAAGPSTPGRPKTEAEPCRPVSAYGRSKLKAERVLLSLRPALPSVLLRLPNLIGSGQRQMETTMALIARRIVPIPGNGDRQTSLCTAADAARALLLAAERSPGRGEIYNVSDGAAYRWEDIVAPLVRVLASGPVVRLRTPALIAVAALMEVGAGIRNAAPRLTVHDVRSARRNYWVFDDSKIRRELEFRPSASVARELERIARAYRDEKGAQRGAVPAKKPMLDGIRSPISRPRA
jgi:dihydroflavonol-4-reductase